MKTISEFITRNTVKIPALVVAIVTFISVFGLFEFDEAQRNAIDGLVAAFLLFFTATTVTANNRIGDGSTFGSFIGGKSE